MERKKPKKQRKNSKKQGGGPGIDASKVTGGGPVIDVSNVTEAIGPSASVTGRTAGTARDAGGKGGKGGELKDKIPGEAARQQQQQQQQPTPKLRQPTTGNDESKEGAAFQQEQQAFCQAVCDLYGGDSYSCKSAVIDAYYTDSSIFRDPLVEVRGKPNILAQFASLNALFSDSSASLLSIGVVKDGDAGVENGTTLHMITTQKFKLKIIPVKIALSVVTEMKLDSTRKIVTHTDDWAVSSVISNIPVVGWALSSVVRPLLGWLSSQLIKVVIPGSKQRLKSP